jgi:hypothetical protein
MNFLFGSQGIVAAVILTLSLAVGSASAQSQPGGVKGKVRTNSGQAIAGADITVTREGKDVKSSVSRSDGSFEVAGLAPGVYGLRVEARGYAAGSMVGVEVKNKLRDLGDRLFLRVDEGTQVIIRGSVFFREGVSVTGAKVEIERIGSDGSAKRLGTTETSVSGEFTFRMPDGAARYRVTAKYKGVEGSKELSVENAAVYRTAISLELSSRDK